MGDEGDDSNEGTGSADGNDGYEADDAEVTLEFWPSICFTSLLGNIEYRKVYILSIFQLFYAFGFVLLWLSLVDYFLR